MEDDLLSVRKKLCMKGEELEDSELSGEGQGHHCEGQQDELGHPGDC